MARICGVDLPKEKRTEIAIQYIQGIGKTRAKDIIKATGINPDIRAKDLTESDVAKLTTFINKNYKTEGDLKRDVLHHIKRLIDIGSYRGSRHRKGLPVRGQRTSTNSRTRKGPRKTVGIQRKGKSMPQQTGKDKK